MQICKITNERTKLKGVRTGCEGGGVVPLISHHCQPGVPGTGLRLVSLKNISSPESWRTSANISEEDLPSASSLNNTFYSPRLLRKHSIINILHLLPEQKY